MVIKINPEFCPQNHRCPVISACPTGAISQIDFGLPIVDSEKCVDCGKCTKLCSTFYDD